MFLLLCLYRTKKATAATRCMCPLYDVDRRGWIELQPMSTARLGHGVVAAGQFWVQRASRDKYFCPSEPVFFCPSEGFLFVIGGEDENKTVLDSGEKYDPDANTWSPIPTMHQVTDHSVGSRTIKWPLSLRPTLALLS